MNRNDLRDKVFWLATLLHSVLGTCDRLRTASSAEKNKRLIGFGYNGSLPGNQHCDEIGHLLIDGHCERTRHGETNLRINATTSLEGSTVRIIGTPCLPCVRDELISSGVKKIDYAGKYPNAKGKELIESLALANNVMLTQKDVDWVAMLQSVLDKLSEPGGVFHGQGFRLKVLKEKV
ncbi:MAG TPA: hypothetical protein VI978_02255 [Candidatus Paceibacterota bacterium]